MQEVALGPSLSFICGSHSIPVNILAKAVEYGPFASVKCVPPHISYFNSGVGFWNHCPFDIRRALEHRQGQSLSAADEDLLLMEVSYEMTTQHTQCLLPEDRVRGLLGFCELSGLKGLNLESLKDVGQVYTLFR
jgi:hypothetical protein